MSNFNHVTLVGRLTNDPELRYTPTGTPLGKVGLAYNAPSRNGEKGETSFFNIVAWGVVAENLAEFKKKGDSILVAGRLSQRSWETPDGTKRSTVEIVASTIEYL